MGMMQHMAGPAGFPHSRIQAKPIPRTTHEQQASPVPNRLSRSGGRSCCTAAGACASSAPLPCLDFLVFFLTFTTPPTGPSAWRALPCFLPPFAMLRRAAARCSGARRESEAWRPGGQQTGRRSAAAGVVGAQLRCREPELRRRPNCADNCCADDWWPIDWCSSLTHRAVPQHDAFVTLKSAPSGDAMPGHAGPAACLRPLCAGMAGQVTVSGCPIHHAAVAVQALRCFLGFGPAACFLPPPAGAAAWPSF